MQHVLKFEIEMIMYPFDYGAGQLKMMERTRNWGLGERRQPNALHIVIVRFEIIEYFKYSEIVSVHNNSIIQKMKGTKYVWDAWA